MKDFMIKHPIITFLIVDEICICIQNVSVSFGKRAFIMPNNKGIIHKGIDRFCEWLKGDEEKKDEF